HVLKTCKGARRAGPTHSQNECAFVRPPLTSYCADVWHLYLPVSGELAARGSCTADLGAMDENIDLQRQFCAGAHGYWQILGRHGLVAGGAGARSSRRVRPPLLPKLAGW